MIPQNYNRSTNVAMEHNTPNYDEVHISVTFTWDIPKAKKLATAWTDKGLVRIGGPAINGESDQPFVAGMYLKKGITITTRGCVRDCSFCMVRKKHFIEFDDFPAGRIVQDNNILASSERHWSLVIDMLKKQSMICFKGGLDKYLLTDKRLEDLRGLRVRELWFACDHKKDILPLSRVLEKVRKAGFERRQILCFVLIGDDMKENENRLREVWNCGAIPFAQLYRDKDNIISHSREWKKFARTCRVQQQSKV